MLKEFKDRFIDGPREKKETAMKEKVETFFGFMHSAGVNVDKLQPEDVARWFLYIKQIDLKPDARSLHMIFAFHHAYIWLDSRIDFNISGEKRNERVPLTASVTQSAQINPHYIGDLNLSLSGEIARISLIKSVPLPKGGAINRIISFENDEGLGFGVLPYPGGMISNFKGIR